MAVLMMTALWIHAQKVTFFSPEFEEGVRHHIGLGETDDVLQTQTDTITRLSLSGMDITDIRDAVYLTAVEELDLSYNRITDVSPLMQLESLRMLNLSKNRLENIDVLAFSLSERMEVDVSNNYIQDFSYFYTPLPCDFTFVGMGLQSERNAPYFNLYQFYADVSDDGQPMVVYRGYTNMATANIKCGTQNVAALLDGNTHEIAITDHLAATSLVTLSNGEQQATTYIVPPANYSVESGKTVTMTTGLPDDYLLTDAYTKDGIVEVVGNTLRYTASTSAMPDIVSFSYSQGDTLKGRSFFYVNRATDVTKGDVNGDGNVNVGDIMAVINVMAGQGSNNAKGDVNEDGKVNVGDIMAVINIMAGK